MKKIFGLGAAVGLVALGLTAPAEAASFLQINVDGNLATCNNSLAFTATNCGAGFTTVANSNTIQFQGTLGGVVFGTGSGTDGVQLVGNQPGLSTSAFSTDTKTTISNSSGASHNVTVGFASSGYTLPQSNLTLRATQTIQDVQGTGATQNFQGWGDQNNGLTPGVGNATSNSGPCAATTAGTSNACNGPIVNFPRLAGAYGLNGIQSFTLASGNIINSQGSVTVTGTPTVPEPASLALLGAGLLAAARRVRRRA